MISQVSKVISDRTDEKIFENWIENMKRPSEFKYFVIETSRSLNTYINEVIEYINDETFYDKN